VILFDLLICLKPKLITLFINFRAKIVNYLTGKIKSSDILLNYNRFFLSALVVTGLASFFMVPGNNIRNIDNKIWGSNWLMGTYSRTRYNLGDKIFDLSMAAGENWFVYTGENSMDDYQNTIPFTTQNLADIQRKLDQLSALLETKGIKLVVIIPPNKNTIYPEYMPPQIPIIGSQSRLDQLMAYQKDHGGFKVIDLRPDLIQASRERLTYFPCGTHWNTFGAFVAYQAIMHSLEKDYPNLTPDKMDEYRFVNILGDTGMADAVHLDNSVCSSSDLEPLPRPQLFTQNWNIAGDAPSYFNRMGTSNITSMNPDSSLPRLLMYRDSFSIYLIPFLSNHFSQAVYLWAYPADDLYIYIENVKPDIIIFEFTERLLFILELIPG
jgi:alginate O-acetyltransferase complex protein AlgJ